VRYELIDSPNGHDAFLKDWDQLNPIVSRFMDRVGAAQQAEKATS
jgi:homoserine acetyltransferase